MNSINVAILDNNEQFLELLKIGLQDHFTFFATSNTQEFEDKVRQPAVLIIDMYLDGETGIDVVRRIRPKQKICHVIFVSATASKEIVLKAYNEGWGGFFLEKDDPNFWDDLVKRVREAKALLRDMAEAMYAQELKDNLIAEQINRTLKSFDG